MPFQSQAQARLFYAAANKPGGIKGLSQGTAQKFINDTDHQKTSSLPRFARIKKALKK